MGTGAQFCLNIYTAYSHKRAFLPGEVGIVSIIAGGLFLITCVLIFYWIRRQQRLAKRGDHLAVESVIFPVFVNVLWIVAFTNLCVFLLTVLVTPPDINLNGGGKGRWTDDVLYAVAWGVQHAVIEGVAFLFMQKGLGMHAAQRAGTLALIWGLFGIVLFILVFTQMDAVATSATLLVWESCILLFFLVLWKCPIKYFYRRPASVLYAKFWVFARVVLMSANIIALYAPPNVYGYCYYAITSTIIFSLLQPTVMYYIFLLDSKWWQGLNISSNIEENSLTYGNITTPLQGLNVNLHSAQSLAHTVDELNGGVKLLNFAYINMFTNQMLGQGSFSKVYRGTYKLQPCAIKLIFTVDLTVDVIARVAAEARILSFVKHPNVIRIFGVAVLPPSVCILLELCELGSLSDVIRGKNKTLKAAEESNIVINKPKPIKMNKGLKSAGAKGKKNPKHGNMGVHRAAELSSLRLCFADIIYLTLGCARGLACLHGISPDMCHRDIKSFNFLVDDQLVAKIADLELGIFKNQVSSTGERNSDDDEVFLPNWAAPEVAQAKGHTQATDVYSFGLVMWEILSGKVPFDDVEDPDDVRDMVAAGKRPLVNFTHPVDMNSDYLKLMERCWKLEPAERPLMKDVVLYLEKMWLNVCHRSITVAKMEVSQAVLPYGPVDFKPSSSALYSTCILSPTINRLLTSMRLDQSWCSLDHNTPPGTTWAVFSQQSPHWLLRPSTSWLADFELVTADVFYCGGFAGIVNCSDENKGDAEKRVRNFLDCFSSGKCGHAVLELKRRDQSTGIYSCHCFPVHSTTTQMNAGGGAPAGGTESCADKQESGVVDDSDKPEADGAETSDASGIPIEPLPLISRITSLSPSEMLGEPNTYSSSANTVSWFRSKRSGSSNSSRHSGIGGYISNPLFPGSTSTNNSSSNNSYNSSSGNSTRDNIRRLTLQRSTSNDSHNYTTHLFNMGTPPEDVPDCTSTPPYVAVLFSYLSSDEDVIRPSIGTNGVGSGLWNTIVSNSSGSARKISKMRSPTMEERSSDKTVERFSVVSTRPSVARSSLGNSFGGPRPSLDLRAFPEFEEI